METVIRLLTAHSDSDPFATEDQASKRLHSKAEQLLVRQLPLTSRHR